MAPLDPKEIREIQAPRVLKENKEIRALRDPKEIVVKWVYQVWQERPDHLVQKVIREIQGHKVRKEIRA
jgi:hypothetical protein